MGSGFNSREILRNSRFHPASWMCIFFGAVDKCSLFGLPTNSVSIELGRNFLQVLRFEMGS